MDLYYIKNAIHILTHHKTTHIMLLRFVVLLYALSCAMYFGTIRSIMLFLIPAAVWIGMSVYLNKNPRWIVEFQWLSFVLFSFLLYPALIGWYTWVGIQASPEPWGVFDTSASFVGRSPCCSSVDRLDGVPCCVSTDLAGACTRYVPYHPAGYFKSGMEAPTATNSPHLTFCPLGKWPDSNNIVPVPYRKNTSVESVTGLGNKCRPEFPCDFLASQLPEDYADLGKGLRMGWQKGATTAPLDFCPGVAVAPNRAGLVGKGLDICSQCAWPKPAHCKDYTHSQFFCFMCPGGYFGSEPAPDPAWQIRLTAELLFGMWALATIATLSAVPNCGVRVRPKGYNPLF